MSPAINITRVAPKNPSRKISKNDLLKQKFARLNSIRLFSNEKDEEFDELDIELLGTNPSYATNK